MTTAGMRATMARSQGKSLASQDRPIPQIESREYVKRAMKA